jgi:hypothetical protein
MRKIFKKKKIKKNGMENVEKQKERLFTRSLEEWNLSNVFTKRHKDKIIGHLLRFKWPWRLLSLFAIRMYIISLITFPLLLSWIQYFYTTLISLGTFEFPSTWRVSMENIIYTYISSHLLAIQNCYASAAPFFIIHQLFFWFHFRSFFVKHICIECPCRRTHLNS